jgi:hypothetical protein
MVTGMVSEAQIHKGMKVICDYYETHEDDDYFTPSIFIKNGIKNPKSLIDSLWADGLITVYDFTENGIFENFSISLTQKGVLYFIEKQRQQRISRKQFAQSVVIAVLSAVVSTVLTLFVSQRSEGSGTSSS